MKMDARIATEAREIGKRESSAPKRPLCPLCEKNYPQIHVKDTEADAVYRVCIACAKDYIANYGPGVSGKMICSILRKASIITDKVIIEAQNTAAAQPPLFT